MAFAERLEGERDNARLTKPLVSCREILLTTTVQLVLHKVSKKQMPSPLASKFQLSCIPYVDDGAFTTCRDQEIGAEFVYNQFARLILKLHIWGKQTIKNTIRILPLTQLLCRPIIHHSHSHRLNLHHPYFCIKCY